MKDAEEHKFTWIGRLDLLFLPNANAFREQEGEIFADWEALSRREVWMKTSIANLIKGVCHENFSLVTNGD